MGTDVNILAIAAASALPAADGALAWIKIIPAGKFQLRDGRGSFDAGGRAEMEAVIAESLRWAGQTELMIDYDHQSVRKEAGAAPAAGWIKALQARDDGIYAQVEWTEAALTRIRAREYRYVSPYFLFDKTTRRVERVMNAGLVNMPAIDFEAIAASLNHNQEATTMKAIAKALGLNESSSEETILAAIAATHEKLASAAGLKKDATSDAIVAAIGGLVRDRGTIAAAVGLKSDATTEAMTAAIVERGAGAGDVVPKASFDQLAADFKSLKDSVESGKVTAAVEQAMKGGKVTPAQKDWATGYAQRDLEGFTAFVQAAPSLTSVQLGSDRTAGAGGERDATELAAAATAYQAEQAAKGVTIGYADAVVHVRDNPPAGK